MDLVHAFTCFTGLYSLDCFGQNETIFAGNDLYLDCRQSSRVSKVKFCFVIKKAFGERAGFIGCRNALFHQKDRVSAFHSDVT